MKSYSFTILEVAAPAFLATPSTYDGSNRLASVTQPDGTRVAYTYTSSGQRASTTVTPPPGGGSASVINDYYQFGQLAYQTDGAGTLLASYTYDTSGAPESVQVGADPANAARYYYVYDARGDVVNLTDVHGVSVASYSYDTWGALTSVSESIPNANGWVNPYRYDGRDGVRSDAATGLDWMRVRAYDPTLGRFLSRDPLGRVPLFLSDNPYVYAGNNPLSNVDPSGQYRVAGQGATRAPSEPFQYHPPKRVVTTPGTSPGTQSTSQAAALKLHPVTVAKMTLHFSAMPNLLDPQAGWDFAFAVLAAAAGIAAIAAAGATFATIGAAGADPVGDLVAIVLFLNGIDAFIHAAVFGARAIWGPGSGIATMLVAFAVIADLVITLMDAATIALLHTPASIGAIVAPLATNAAALTTIYTLTGIDLGADLGDLKDLLGG